MEKNEKSWDDIPSLEGLGIDWDFEPENPLGNRAYARLTTKELYVLFQKKEIPVRLATEKKEARALLIDLAQGGLSLRVKEGIWKESQLVKLGCFLGKQKLLSKGRIKNVRQEKDCMILGIEFVGLSEETHDYISNLYSSVKMAK